jgi:hypothetical protein
MNNGAWRQHGPAQLLLPHGRRPRVDLPVGLRGRDLVRPPEQLLQPGLFHIDIEVPVLLGVCHETQDIGRPLL